MMVLSVLFSILTLALPVVLVVLLVRHRMTGPGAGPVDGRSVRRFFQYLLLFGLMIVAVVGLGDLLARPVELRPGGTSDLARILAFTVFGVPMVVGVAWWTARDHRRDPAERASFAWTAYVTVASLSTLVVAMSHAHDAVRSWVDPTELDAGATVRFGVWALVWAAHWVLAGRALPDRRRDPGLAVGSLAGLAATLAGLVSLLGVAGQALLGGAARPSGYLVGSAVAMTAVGVPVWWLHWLRHFRSSTPGGLWLAYVLLVGVGGGFVMAVVGGAAALNSAGVWLLGDPSGSTAAEHFTSTPTALGAVVLGALTWWYHRVTFARGGPRGRTELTRVHEYLLAAIALVATAVGVVSGVSALADLVAPAAHGSSFANGLIGAVTLLVVGAPLWWWFWSGAQRALAADPGPELASPTRRVYLFVLFGVGGVVAVIAILVAAFVGIEAGLRGELGGETVQDLGTPLGLLVATATISGYHWAVFRRERRMAPPKGVTRGPRDVLIVGPMDEDVAADVHRATGASVQVWTTEGTPWSGTDVLAAIGDAAGGIPDGGALVVVAVDGAPRAVQAERRRS